MGFWRVVAKSFLDDKEFKQATEQQDAYNATRVQQSQGPSRRQVRQWDDDANVWNSMLDYSRTVMDDRDQDIRQRREEIKTIIGGCWCNDPNCQNR
jgi:hypothetical protein